LGIGCFSISGKPSRSKKNFLSPQIEKSILMKIIYRLLIVLCFIAFSCEKASYYPSDTSAYTTKNLQVSEKVIQMDQNLVMDNYSWEVNEGTYRYYYTGDAPEAEVGSILVDTINGGCIRKVEEIIQNDQGLLKVRTSQATLSDLFTGGQLECVIGMDENLKSSGDIHYKDLTSIFAPGFKTTEPMVYEFETKLTNDVTLTGTITFKPRIYLNWKFSEGNELNQMDFYLDNTKLIMDATLSISNSYGISKTVQKSFGKVRKRGYFQASFLPVVFEMEMELIGYGILEIEEESDFPVSITQTSSLSYGVSYSNGEAQFVKGFTNDFEFGADPSIETNARLQISLVPQISVKFYNILGAIIKPKPYIDVNAHYINESGLQESCAQVDAGMDLGLSLRAEIFDNHLFDLSKDFPVARNTLWKSDNNCILPVIEISEPLWAPGTHECPGTTPYEITFQVNDPERLLGEGTVLNAMHRFHYASGEITQGSITRTWDEMNYAAEKLSYTICIGWVDAQFVEQSLWIVSADGTQSNMVSVIIPRGSH